MTGSRHTRLYWVHRQMLKRCGIASGASEKQLSRYLMRGITVCDDWLDWHAFKSWAESSGYREGLTLDRIDNDGPYCPENCRWVDRTASMRNTSRTYAVRGVDVVTGASAVFGSCADAADFMGGHRGHISKCVSGKGNVAYGCVWERVDA